MIWRCGCGAQASTLVGSDEERTLPAGWVRVKYRSRRMRRIETVHGCCREHAIEVAIKYGTLVEVES